MNRAELKLRAKQQLGGKLFGENWLSALLVILVYSVILGVSTIVYVGPLILTGPLSLGLSYLFLKQARDGQKMEIEGLFAGFKEDFLNNFLIGLMTGIFTFLWSLLFIVPGIIKAYSYSMAYFIKADNPDYDWKQCIEESKQMTNGHKGELFVLDLSFIGWAIVCSFTFGIGYLWLEPYMEATRAQFYNSLKTGA